jgi:hypothetical protein
VKRVSVAVFASLAGFIVGTAGVALLGAVLTMLRPGIEYSSRAAVFAAPLSLIVEGLFWAIGGGAMFVLPIAVIALAVFRPADTPKSAAALTAVLIAPIVAGNYPNRAIEAVLMAVPVWVGVRVGLRIAARLR